MNVRLLFALATVTLGLCRPLGAVTVSSHYTEDATVIFDGDATVTDMVIDEGVTVTFASDTPETNLRTLTFDNISGGGTLRVKRIKLISTKNDSRVLGVGRIEILKVKESSLADYEGGLFSCIHSPGINWLTVTSAIAGDGALSFENTLRFAGDNTAFAGYAKISSARREKCFMTTSSLFSGAALFENDTCDRFMFAFTSGVAHFGPVKWTCACTLYLNHSDDDSNDLVMEFEGGEIGAGDAIYTIKTWAPNETMAGTGTSGDGCANLVIRKVGKGVLTPQLSKAYGKPLEIVSGRWNFSNIGDLPSAVVVKSGAEISCAEKVAGQISLPGTLRLEDGARIIGTPYVNADGDYALTILRTSTYGNTTWDGNFYLGVTDPTKLTLNKAYQIFAMTGQEFVPASRCLDGDCARIGKSSTNVSITYTKYPDPTPAKPKRIIVFVC